MNESANLKGSKSLCKYITPGFDAVKVIAFDLDWTLTHGEQHLYPRNVDDIHWLPRREHRLGKLHTKGYNFCIFTNQFARSAKERDVKLARVQTFIRSFPWPVAVYISLQKDEFRKPAGGMWKEFVSAYPDAHIVGYCGDALGRPQDFSDSDRMFAERRGVTVIEPERMFKVKLPKIETGKQMILFVGAPGCGKSTYYREHLEPKGYRWVNQDTLKTDVKVMKAVHAAMVDGVDVCIDRTNGPLAKRTIFYDAAMTNGYTVIVIYFVRDGYGWNKIREKPVSTIVYHIFYKNLESPTRENTPGTVYRI